MRNVAACKTYANICSAIIYVIIHRQQNSVLTYHRSYLHEHAKAAKRVQIRQWKKIKILDK